MKKGEVNSTIVFVLIILIVSVGLMTYNEGFQNPYGIGADRATGPNAGPRPTTTSFYPTYTLDELNNYRRYVRENPPTIVSYQNRCVGLPVPCRFSNMNADTWYNVVQKQRRLSEGYPLDAVMREIAITREHDGVRYDEAGPNAAANMTSDYGASYGAVYGPV